MAHSLLWDKLTATDMQILEKLRTADEIKPFLVNLFSTRSSASSSSSSSWLITDNSDPQKEAKNEILLDFFFHTLRFCREVLFDAEKTSTLFSIMYWTHHHSMAKRCSASDSFEIFQKYITTHSVHRPPFSVAIFSVPDVQAINHYVMETYYRNYKLYLYAFTPRETVTVQSIYATDRVQKAPVPRPLAQAIPEEEWMKKQDEKKAQAAAQAEAERKAKEESEAKARKATLPPKEDGNGLAQAPEGIRGQLDFIKSQVMKMTTGKMDEIEAKLDMLESRVAAEEAKTPGKKPTPKKK